MKIRALRNDTTLEFPDGLVLTVHKKTTDVPPEMEGDVRRVLTAGVFGIEEVKDPKPAPAAAEKKEG